MPELPEVTAYVEGLDRLLGGRVLEDVRVRSPSLLKTWDPPLRDARGCRVQGFRRIGKRVVWELEGELFLVFHLMIAGRFHWKPGDARAPAGAEEADGSRGGRRVGAGRSPIPRRTGHAAFDFGHGSMLLTETATKKRTSLWVVRGEGTLAAHDPGGIEPLEADLETFRAALRRENRTLKRALTDPRILSGIGNAHSDEILLLSRLSPLQRTGNLSDEELERLWRVTRTNLGRWIERLRDEFGREFPEKITAFHPAMAAHGRYGEPCPVCGTPIQRVKYADRETNYCPTCQTGGKLLADRGMSRLLGDDWPATLEELEELRAEHRK